jgi:glycosyltransferase involved in cell wall biosynthesis
MRVKFSICAPAFNGPKELPDLLITVAAEEPEDWEILVAEDRLPKLEDQWRFVGRQ